MLIAISSSQGAGKSTLITALKQHGYFTVERKTSRSILTEWGVALRDINTDRDLTIRFQDEILNRKMRDDTEASIQPGITFTERSFVDLFVYSLVVLGHDNANSEWLDSYYRRCIAAQQLYNKVYYLTAGHFKVVDDGVRGSNRHYSRLVDIVLRDYYQQMTIPTKQCVIDTPSFEDRLAIMMAHNPL